MFRLFLAATLVAALAHGAKAADDDYLLIELKSGTVKIELLPEVAPEHVARVVDLAKSGAYDGIAFHRVLEGFMAQTGDVRYGKVTADGTVSNRAGTGDSDLPDLKAEFSDLPFDRGAVGAARTNDPNSANSQFFIMTEPAHYLNGQYTVWGRVVEGMEHVDNIKKGGPPSGKVTKPDRMIRVSVVGDETN